MGEVENFESLLLILRKHGVSKYQSHAFTVELSERAALKEPLANNDLEEKSLSPAEQKIAEEKILFYSAK